MAVRTSGWIPALESSTIDWTELSNSVSDASIFATMTCGSIPAAPRARTSWLESGRSTSSCAMFGTARNTSASRIEGARIIGCSVWLEIRAALLK